MVNPATELNSVTDPLLRYASRVIDHLADARPRTLQRLLEDVLEGLGQRLGVEHMHLFSVQRQSDGQELVSLSVAWSQSGRQLPREPLQRVPLQLFSSSIVEYLQHGQPAFVPLTSDKGECARLVASVLRETGTTGYVLCPVLLKKRLRGILAVAHDRGPEHLTSACCYQLRLIGKLLVQAIRTVRRESRQRRAHRQWKKIADAACDFAMVVDAAGEILQLIPFGSGRTPPVQGLRLEDFVQRPFHGDVQRAIQQALRQREPRTCDARGMGANGSVCWYHVRVEPQYSPGNSTVTLFLSDIGVQREQQDELQKLQDHLHRASRLSLLGQISTEFAHQINQPLQAIMTFCETMQLRERNGNATPAKRQTSLSNIMAAVEQATAIVQRIREFAQRRSLQLDNCDLSSIIHRALVMARPRAEQCGVLLIDQTQLQSGRLAPDAEADSEESENTVLADDVQTTQVLINLLVNAIEACQQAGTNGARVEVGVEQVPDESGFLVRVTDNGPGLPTDNPDWVFEKFCTTKAEGLGMGLAISRTVIEAQHGRMWAENNAGGSGCTFWFTVRRGGSRLSDTDEMRIIQAGEPQPD